jgi:hypothetical protein
MFKDHLKNGKGTIFYPDGTSLQGFWHNDKLFMNNYL